MLETRPDERRAQPLAVAVPRLSPLARTSFRYAALAALLAFTAGLSLIALVNPEAAGANWGREDGFWIFPVVAALVYLVPGVVVLLRSDWHPVGWFLCNLAVGFNFSFSPVIDPVDDLGRWWAWLTDVSTNGVFWTVWTGLILVFPRPISQRPPDERRLPWTLLGVDTLAVVVLVLRESVTAGDTTIPSPFPLAFVGEAVGAVAGFVPLALLPVALYDFVRRYRRSGPVERQQYRWVTSAIVYVGAALLLGIISTAVTGTEDNIGWIPLVLGYLLVPVAFMVAILKYRLYSIDKLVSRTLTYAAVVTAIAAIYVLPVLFVGRIVGSTSDLVIAAATLVAAAAFNPIRRRAQRLVDRRFNRGRYDAETIIGEFTLGLRDQVDLAEILTDLDDVVARTVQPGLATTWLRAGS